MVRSNGAASAANAVSVELVVGALQSARREMEVLIERTAMSPVIREKKDLFAGFFDKHGRLLVTTDMPIFGHILEPIFATYSVEDMAPGDVYWFNDPYATNGGVSHTPDQVLVAPIFHDGSLIGFTKAMAHFIEIGGIRPGTLSPEATEIFHEGTMVPPVRLVNAGQLNKELLRVFVRNSRQPEMVRGDVRALMAALELGRVRFCEMFNRFGGDIANSAFDTIIDSTERAFREWMAEEFPDGTYPMSETVGTDGHGGGPFTLRVSLNAAGGKYSFDFTETDGQAAGPINYLMNEEMPKMVFGIYLGSGRKSWMLNQGVLSAIDDVKLRQRTLVSPQFPAPIGNRGPTLFRVQSACLGLINSGRSGPRQASNGVYNVLLFRTHDSGTGKLSLWADGIGVGYGARWWCDGLDVIYYISQQNYPVEFVESVYPFRVREYRINPDSGGPGRWRGGCGVIREVEFVGDGEALVATRMDQIPPWGTAGGSAGRTGRYVRNPGTSSERTISALSDDNVLMKGDVFRTETGGGGGFGNPLERPAEMVSRDVLDGFVTTQHALTDYGVVLRADGSINYYATNQYRQSRATNVVERRSLRPLWNHHCTHRRRGCRDGGVVS